MAKSHEDKEDVGEHARMMMFPDINSYIVVFKVGEEIDVVIDMGLSTLRNSLFDHHSPPHWNAYELRRNSDYNFTWINIQIMVIIFSLSCLQWETSKTKFPKHEQSSVMWVDSIFHLPHDCRIIDSPGSLKILIIVVSLVDVINERVGSFSACLAAFLGKLWKCESDLKLWMERLKGQTN